MATGAQNRSVAAPQPVSGRDLRITSAQKKDASGEKTEERVEETNLGNPSDGVQVRNKTKYLVQYAATGTQQTKSTQVRDAPANLEAFRSRRGNQIALCKRRKNSPRIPRKSLT
jgi:hypothetical protein